MILEFGIWCFKTGATFIISQQLGDQRHGHIWSSMSFFKRLLDIPSATNSARFCITPLMLLRIFDTQRYHSLRHFDFLPKRGLLHAYKTSVPSRQNTGPGLAAFVLEAGAYIAFSDARSMRFWGFFTAREFGEWFHYFVFLCTSFYVLYIH